MGAEWALPTRRTHSASYLTLTWSCVGSPLAWSCASRDERSPPPRFDCPMVLTAPAIHCPTGLVAQVHNRFQYSTLRLATAPTRTA